MLKRIFYFGLGVTGALVDFASGIAHAGEDFLRKRFSKTSAPQAAAVEGGLQTESEPELATSLAITASTRVDDLTRIKGIGPTFARRLQAAEITTYAQLASLSPGRVKEITRIAEWQGDPEAWIKQAEILAFSTTL